MKKLTNADNTPQTSKEKPLPCLCCPSSISIRAIKSLLVRSFSSRFYLVNSCITCTCFAFRCKKRCYDEGHPSYQIWHGSREPFQIWRHYLKGCECHLSTERLLSKPSNTAKAAQGFLRKDLFSVKKGGLSKAYRNKSSNYRLSAGDESLHPPL